VGGRTVTAVDPCWYTAKVWQIRGEGTVAGKRTYIKILTQEKTVKMVDSVPTISPTIWSWRSAYSANRQVELEGTPDKHCLHGSQACLASERLAHQRHQVVRHRAAPPQHRTHLPPQPQRGDGNVQPAAGSLPGLTWPAPTLAWLRVHGRQHRRHRHGLGERGRAARAARCLVPRGMPACPMSGGVRLLFQVTGGSPGRRVFRFLFAVESSAGSK
jgi:hypothetical protein